MLCLLDFLNINTNTNKSLPQPILRHTQPFRAAYTDQPLRFHEYSHSIVIDTPFGKERPELPLVKLARLQNTNDQEAT